MEHIAAVENYLTLEALFILKYVLVLNEYYNHIHIAEELVEARVLVPVSYTHLTLPTIA